MSAALPDHIARRQGVSTGGFIWGHGARHRAIDRDSNHEDPRHLFRTRGFQPGQRTEWAGLLLMIERFDAADWRLGRTRELFDGAPARDWDDEHGAWFRILIRDNREYDDLESPAGKSDYHAMGACCEVPRSGLAG